MFDFKAHLFYGLNLLFALVPSMETESPFNTDNANLFHLDTPFVKIAV